MLEDFVILHEVSGRTLTVWTFRVAMSLVEIQPYRSGVTALISVATLGFILTLVRQVRENAQDRLAVQEDRNRSAHEGD